MGRQSNRAVLLVDDEAGQRQLIETVVTRAGYRARQVSGGRAAVELLTGPEGNDIGAVILDLSMPDMTGLEVLAAVRPLRPTLPMIMLTGHSSVSTAVKAMRAGATDFLIKPASPDRVLAALSAAMNDALPNGELRPLTEKLTQSLAFTEIVGEAPAFRDALKLAAKAAKRNVPVLIEGESGVGKEVVAQAIHAASPRARAPLVVVNCGAIPANLVESVLFGHEKGAFTGAVERHIGRFGEADGGTLFLDEIGELPLEAQVKLLRALQTGQIEPVGGRGSSTVDVRIIAATNRDLASEVAAGRFREDLYYRLNVVPVTLPPLRARKGDIAALAKHFLARIRAQEDVAPQAISDEALALLTRFDWPGNVRQLQNALFRASVLCDDSILTPRDFPQLLSQSTGGAVPSAATSAGTRSNGHTITADPLGIQLFDGQGHLRPLESIEADVIKLAISHYRGRMSEVARRLQIGRSTLYRKLAELGLDTRD